MSQTTAAPAAASPDRSEHALAPLNTFDKKDIAAGAAVVDKWLREVTDGYITLERVQTVAGSLPVLGNILALVDVFGDLITIYEKRDKAGFDDWFALGTDLIGIIPGVGGPARMALRPAIHALKKELPKIIANGAKGQISDALVEVLLKHVNDSMVGEIETFAATAQTKLAGFVDDAAKILDALIDGLIEILNLLTGDKPAPKPVAASGPAYKPQDTSMRGLFGHVMKIYREVGKGLIEAAAGLALNETAKGKIRLVIAGLKNIKGVCRGKLQELVSGGANGGMMRLLDALVASAKKLRKKKDAKPQQQTNINNGKTGEAKEPKTGAHLDSSATQAPGTDPNPCRVCPAPQPKTPLSISYITGAETVTHTDFVLPAPLPIAWDRTYRSNLAAYDQGSLGAR